VRVCSESNLPPDGSRIVKLGALAPSSDHLGNLLHLPPHRWAARRQVGDNGCGGHGRGRPGWGNRGAVTWHPNPGRNGIGATRATDRGAGPHTGRRSVSPPRWGALAFLTFWRTDHDHAHEDERAHPIVHAVADAGPGRPGPARMHRKGEPREGERGVGVSPRAMWTPH